MPKAKSVTLAAPRTLARFGRASGLQVRLAVERLDGAEVTDQDRATVAADVWVLDALASRSAAALTKIAALASQCLAHPPSVPVAAPKPSTARKPSAKPRKRAAAKRP